nr:hypothetical protein [Schwartzia sp. (in: firmicutes)]
MSIKKCSKVVFLSLWAVGLLFTSAVFAYEYVPEPITPSDYVDYWNGAGVYAPKPIQPNTNSNSYS